MASDPLGYFSDKLVRCIEIDSKRSLCGFPCCCSGETPQFIRPQFYPQELSDIVSQQDLYALLDDCDKVWRGSGFPIFPCSILCGLTVVCVPTYVWWQSCNKDRRKKDLDSLVKSWNEKHRSEGVYLQWNTIFYMGAGRQEGLAGEVSELQARLGLPGLNVMINPDARDAYLNRGRQ